MKKYHIKEEDYNRANELSKRNKNKRVDKRLQVIILRYEGFTDAEISYKTGYHSKTVSALCVECCKVGVDEYAKIKYGGNHRSLSQKEEEEILSTFRKKAEAGQIVSVKEIKAAFDEKIGKDTGRGYIYMLLERHKWRQVMPRSKHPNKASDEVIEASKKLTKKQMKSGVHMSSET